MIKEVEYIRDYQLKIRFVDGTEKIIDLYSFISKSNHPLIRKYLDINFFKKFHVDCGTVCWGDNEFDIDPMRVKQGFYDVKKLVTN